MTVFPDVPERRRAGERPQRSLEAPRATDRHRRALAARLVAAQQEERARVAAAIHDDTVQTMTAVGMRLDMLRRTLSTPEQIDALDRVQGSVPDALARLAQEALTNVRRHADASTVEITLEDREGGIAVRISDDGAGYGRRKRSVPDRGTWGSPP